MSAPIPYKVQSGETLQDIAKKLGIKDWTELKKYHNQNAGSDQQTSDIPYAGFNLMTPTQEEIYEINGETPPADPVKEQKEAEQKQGEEKKKEEEEKKEEEASKSDHDGKYFVVHNAKCVCDKAENPKQTADLQVTTHKIIVLNDDSSKLAATEEDKTFIPPVATFGKCTLKPSSAGNLPCALAAAPKWSKTYESTQVMGKNTLTEISELQCMVGGKITIDKHGQTDSVSNAHADNTNPLELAAVNPAIEQPKKKEEYPVVTSISLTKIEDRKDFKEVDSKKKDIIYLRKNEEADFKANLKSGNKQLTSWMVYSDHQGKKENRLLLKEQIGTEFSQSFADLGKFRIEGYGKPKSPDFEKGKYDKCDPSCSIDVEVVENTLLDIECTSGDFSTRIDPSKNRKFRRGVPSVFKAKFFIPNLTEEEKSRLTLSLLDGSGNVVTDAVQNGETLTFTPQNTQAKYTIVAKYIDDTGNAIEKQMSGETEGNSVIAISHGAEVVRPGTAMSFSVSKMKYNFGNNPVYDLTSDESSEVKWNLNGVLQGTGKSITIPGNQLIAPGKYVVEAYSKVANATGKGGKDEEDDWRFEVKNNVVTEIKYDKKPKVGVNILFEISKMLIKDYDATKDGSIIWKITGPITATGAGEKFSYKFSAPGKYTINCSMGGRNCEKPLSIDVVQPKINTDTAKWMDNDGSSGNIIKEAGYGQDIAAYVRYEGLQGEEVKLEVYDNDSTGSNIIFEKSGILSDTATAVYWPFTLDDSIKQKIESKGATKKGELFFKMKSTNPSLVIQNSDKALASSLIVSDIPKIVDAYFCDASDTEKRYNSPISTPLYFKIYAINMVDKNVEVHFITKSDIYFSIAWNPKQWKDWKDVKDKFSKEVFFNTQQGKINKKGELILKVDPAKLGKPKNYFKISAIIKVTEGEGKDAKEKAVYLDHSDMAILYATATLPNMVENKGAVKVGRETLSTGNSKETDCCLIDEEFFLTNYEKEFPNVDKKGKPIPLGESVKGSLRRMFKSISEYYSNEKRCCNKYHIAYMLATAKLETGHTFDPVEEANWLSWSVRKNYFEEMYDPILGKNENRRKMARDNENTTQGDGEKYFGRGYVQLTWKKNYRKMQEKFKVDLINKRENALNHELAIKIMIYGSEQGIFTGAKLSTFINDSKKDYYNARRVINGTDEAAKIEGYAEKIEKCLKIKECNCGGKADNGTPCPTCKKTHYNVAKPEHWITQEPSECWAASVKVLKNYGITGGARANCIIVANQDEDTLTPVNAQTGIDYIDSQLKAGNPVVVGLDDNLRQTTYNAHKATDHFFVIVGSGCDNGKKFYNFFDVGSKTKEAGTSSSNKMYIKDNLLIEGKSNGGSHNYTVTEIRRNQ